MNEKGLPSGKPFLWLLCAAYQTKELSLFTFYSVFDVLGDFLWVSEWKGFLYFAYFADDGNRGRVRTIPCKDRIAANKVLNVAVTYICFLGSKAHCFGERFRKIGFQIRNIERRKIATLFGAIPCAVCFNRVFFVSKAGNLMITAPCIGIDIGYVVLFALFSERINMDFFFSCTHRQFLLVNKFLFGWHSVQIPIPANAVSIVEMI